MAILCAVDFSRASGVALTAADRIAVTFRQPLVVINVADPLLAAAERMHSHTDPLDLLKQALVAFVDETLGAGASTRHDVSIAIGDPATEILVRADAIEADLVVLATQGASGVGRFVFGSVAERVLRTTTRPVLAVPPSAGEGPMRTLGAMHEVLAPIEFKGHALDDARLAQRVATASHARLRLLHVVPSDDAGRWSVLLRPLAEQIEDQLTGVRTTARDAARQALERLGDAIGGTPGPTLEIGDGPVAQRIAEVADRAEVDLIVLGLRGEPGLLGGTRVGAVAYRVLCASPVPVLAVPHEARGGTALAFIDAAPAPRG